MRRQGCRREHNLAALHRRCLLLDGRGVVVGLNGHRAPPTRPRGGTAWAAAPWSSRERPARLLRLFPLLRCLPVLLCPVLALSLGIQALLARTHHLLLQCLEPYPLLLLFQGLATGFLVLRLGLLPAQARLGQVRLGPQLRHLLRGFHVPGLLQAAHPHFGPLPLPLQQIARLKQVGLVVVGSSSRRMRERRTRSFPTTGEGRGCRTARAGKRAEGAVVVHAPAAGRANLLILRASGMDGRQGPGLEVARVALLLLPCPQVRVPLLLQGLVSPQAVEAGRVKPGGGQRAAASSHRWSWGSSSPVHAAPFSSAALRREVVFPSPRARDAAFVERQGEVRPAATRRTGPCGKAMDAWRRGSQGPGCWD